MKNHACIFLRGFIDHQECMSLINVGIIKHDIYNVVMFCLRGTSIEKDFLLCVKTLSSIGFAKSTLNLKIHALRLGLKMVH
jgi:hypothetical protein